jgi:hypothetical protein
MIRKGYFATWASALASALLAMGVLAGCDTGNQQQEPGSPATEDQAGDDLAMYEPDDTAGDRTGSADDPTGTASDPSTASDPGTADDPMMGADRSQQTGQPGMTPGGTLENMNADEIVGKSVVSQNGEEIGDVEDVVTDPTSGQKYAVVDVGGFLGVGQKSVVIGLNELKMSAADDRIQSELTREELQTQTEYSPDKYESMTGGETGETGEPSTDPTQQQ